jgi:N-acyl-D-amino-acid deacylase
MRIVLLVFFAATALHAQDYDLVLRHGRVLDGSGAPAIAADVAIKDGRIAAVGKITGTARAEIDATGKTVAPGFIDVHTHSEDVSELPEAENFLRMGVTTIVTGNCGTSTTDVAHFFSTLERTKVALNVATLVGHGSVRFQVMGGSFSRPPTADELAKMAALVDEGMKAGAVGLSTGLIYLPGTFAKTEEIVALAKAASAHGGLYASHIRYENARILEALTELTTIAREAKIPAEVSHLKLSSPAAWGRTDEIVAFLDKARAEGLKITHDQYVYTASSTSIGSRIPEEALEGGREAFLKRMADPAQKARFVAEMKATLARNRQPDYSFAVIANFAADRSLNGKNLVQAAKQVRGSDSLDDQIELILDIQARGGAQGVFHGMDEGDLQKFLVLPLTMIASDSGIR